MSIIQIEPTRRTGCAIWRCGARLIIESGSTIMAFALPER